MPLWTRIERLGGRIVLVGAIAACVALIALIFLGGQTSRILNVVGAPISDHIGSGSGSQPGNDIGSGNGSQGTPVGDGQRAAVVDVARPDLLIVRTGLLDLQVTDVPRAVEAATREIEAAGGYLSDSEQTGEGQEVSASATYRIPVEAWSSTLAAIRSLAIKVVAVEIRTDDVTTQVVDLRARIANLEVTERAMQAIMAQATKIDDILKIQKELTSIRGDIEEAVARKKGFEDQAAYSTLTVRFGLTPVAAVAPPPRPGFDPGSEVDRAAAQLIHRMEHVTAAGIWFGIVWLPFLLVLAVGAVPAVLIARSRRRRGPAEATAT